MPEGLSLIQVGQMYFNKWDRDPGQRIADRDAGVRICRRVDDDEIGAVLPGRLNAVNQRAFVIALPRAQRGAKSPASRSRPSLIWDSVRLP